MYISYANLWKLLIDKGITKTELAELAKSALAHLPSFQKIKRLQRKPCLLFAKR